MIDTDKYEGHLLINGEFSKQVCTPKEYHATKALLNDAPLLLEEVKRWRKLAKICLEAIEAGGDIRSGTIEVIEANLKGMIE